MNKKVSIISGLGLIIVGLILLITNEYINVHKYSLTSEALKNYTVVDKYDIKNEGKLVWTYGNLNYSGKTIDDTFKVEVDSPILLRTVEMYQWKEYCDKKCTYRKVWSKEHIDSNKFEKIAYHNPSSFPYQTNTFTNYSTNINDFIVPSNLLQKLKTNKQIQNLDSSNINELGFKVSDDGKYYTNVLDNTPNIGDLRISYSYLTKKDVSILAKQSSNTFEQYKQKNNKNIYEIKNGNINPKQILKKINNDNNFIKWIFRLLSIIIIMLGLILSIDFIKEKIKLFNLPNIIYGPVLGLIISLVIIAVMWIIYKPLTSIILLVVAILLIIIFKKIKIEFKRKKDDQNVETLKI